EPKSWWVTHGALADEDFNLSAARYKPQVGEKPPEDDPRDLVKKTLAIEEDIAAGLESLLAELGEAD
ncbi:SAM-dependent DNA methyltransferase, partial [Verrucomicrobiota bacterium]